MAVVVTAAALVLLTGPGAFADPSPSASPGATDAKLGPATPGTAVCTVNNTNVDEVTGMVATAQGIYAVEGGNTFDPNSVQIWTINPTSCQATSKNYGFDPADPQDLALGADGALWIADTGDGVGDDNERVRVTMERVDLSGSAQAVPYRMLFPDSGKINAPAVLLQKDNAPIIVANASGKAILYRPDGPLQQGTESGLPKLTQVGEFTPAKTGTANPLGAFGNVLVTGAATSPDRTRVVIRTISDAYEFKVGADGDIVKAITEGTPAITPLPNEEDGQAISYSADGTLFLTLGSVDKPALRSYTPYVPPAPKVDVETPAAEGSGRLSFSDITNIAAAVGFAGFLAVVAGVIGIYRARRQYRERAEWSEDAEDRDDHGGRGPRDGHGGRDRREGRGGDGRGQRPMRPDSRGDGGRRPHGEDGPDRPPRGLPARPGRADVWGPANQSDAGRRAHGGHDDLAEHGQRQSGHHQGPPQGPPYGKAQVSPPSQPPGPPPGPPPSPASGRAPRPRPTGSGQVYGRPRQEPDGGNEPPRQGGYGHDNIDH
jgi:hypothetical protein